MKVARVLGVLPMLVLAACGGDAEPPPTGPMTVAVQHYDYRFDLDSREASVVLTMRVLEGGNCVDLPMRAHDLRATTLDGEDAYGALEGGVLTACRATGWFAGAEVALAAAVRIPQETWSDSQVGYSISPDLENNPFYYLVSWVGGCDRFGPCDASPAAFARYRFTVTHREGVEVLCPGVVTPGATETVCDFDLPGGPTYSTFGVVASSSWERSSLGRWGEVDVVLYDMPSSGVAAALDVDNHRGFLAFMEERFGPYPYGDELRLIVGPTYWNGFEHPGNIVLYDGLPKATSAYANALAHTVNHEIAHQWAGDQTTLATTHDFVWKEAMAEYLTFVYEEEVLGAQVGALTPRAWKTFSRQARFYPVPAEKPPLLDYYGDVYGPGPMVLFRQLEALFDRDAVFTALGMLLGEERAIGVADVQAALEAATGADLSTYFDTWVYGEGTPAWPTFAVAIDDQGGGTVAVTVTQQGATRWGAAFAVQLTGGAATDRYDVWFDLGPDGAATKTVTATDVPFEVTGHRFDPHNHTLAREAAATVAAPTGPRNPWLSARALRR